MLKSEKSEKDETYSPSNHDSDASDNYSCNEDSAVGSGDDRCMTTIHIPEMKQIKFKKHHPVLQIPVLMKVNFMKYSYRMFCLFRLHANSILWNAWPEYFQWNIYNFSANIYIT